MAKNMNGKDHHDKNGKAGSAEETLHFEPGIKEITDKLYAEHVSNIDTEVYVYTSLGEYSRDRSRIIVHTTVVEDDISPFRHESAEYAWFGAGVLEAESGRLVYLDGGLYYRGNTKLYSERHHGAVLDHNGSRLLTFGDRLTIRTLRGGTDFRAGDVKDLGVGEFLYAEFMDDDRYVLCTDVNNCARVIDTVTGQEVPPGTPFVKLTRRLTH